MGLVKIEFPEGLIKKLKSVEGKTQEVLTTTLRAGAEEVKPVFAAHLASVIGRDTKYPSRSTGELKSAIGIAPVRVTEEGVLNIKIGFYEPRSNGEYNAKIANILEHGKQGQPAKPFIAATRKAVEKTAVDTMQRVFAEQVEAL